MKAIKSLILTAALALALPLSAFAAVPWGTVSAQTGATPTCTTFSTAPVCIDTLSTTQTSLTISGGTAGGYYTVVIMQDGTGSRTFTAPTNVVADTANGIASIPAPPSAANAYTAWVLKATGTTPTYLLEGVYDNVSLNNVFATTTTTAGTAITGGTTQSVGSVVVPGVTVASIAVCAPQTTPASWQTGIFMNAITGTNFVQCQIVDPVGVTTVTPTAVTVNIRVMTP